MQARNPLQAQPTSPLGRARVNARLSARAKRTARAANAAAAGRAFFQPAPLALAIALAVGGAGYWPQAVQAQTTSSIQIAAQPLGSALNELARQAGLQLTANPDLLAGKTGPAVSGNLTAQQALNQLLAGSGLVGNVSGNAVVIRAAPPQVSSELDTLPEVVVTASPSNLTEGSGSFTTAGPAGQAATGMNLSLKETPQSVSVMTRERMDQQGLTSITDVLNQTAGLFVESGLGGTPIGGANQVVSRGFAVRNFQVDGALGAQRAWGNYNYSGVGAIDTAIYDSFTVVRGATGLMTGAGDPSASVNMTRKRPTHEFQGSLEGTFGRWDQRRTVADFGGPLNASGTLRGRLVGAYDEGKSWVRAYKGDRSVIYGVLEADLTQDTLLNVSWEHAEEDSNAHDRLATYGLFFGNGERTPFNRHDSLILPWSSWNVERSTVTANLEHHFNGDWSAKLSASHSARNNSRKYLDYYYGTNPDLTVSGAELYRMNNDVSINSIDLKINGLYRLFGRHHDLAIGFNGTDSKNERTENYIDRTSAAGSPIIDGIPMIPEPDWANMTNYAPDRTKEKQYGFFLSSRLRPTDDLSLIIGGRWSSWKISTTMPESNPWYSYYPQGISDARKYSNVFIPYAGIVYDLTDNLSVYGSVTEIFQPQDYKDVDGKLLDPEEGVNYELGAKGEWFNGRLNGSIAVFQTKKDNLAIRDSDDMFTPDGDWAYRAADNVKTKGWELEVAGELARGWHLQAGYTRSVHRESDGTRLSTGTPIHLFKLFTSYTPQSLPRLTMGGGVNWQSKIYSTQYTDWRKDYAQQKAYAVVNLMAHYGITDQLSLTLNLNNALNKNYRVSTTSHSYGAERNLSASLKYRF